MNEHNKECDQSKCGQFPNCNNYACNGEHDCTCPVTTQEPTNSDEKTAPISN